MFLMNDARHHDDPDALHDLVVAISGGKTTVANHLPLCEELWSDPCSRSWLAAALIRKAAVPAIETDQACTVFLAGKVREALELLPCPQKPSQEEVAEFLPAIVHLMPEEAWSRAGTLWQSLLSAVRDEFDIPFPPGTKPEDETIDVQARELAQLFADCVGLPWSREFEERLAAWRDTPQYSWLVALRRTARIEEILDGVRRRLSDAGMLDDANLLERLQRMSPFERRRLIVMREAVRQETIWADPAIESASSTINWSFRVPLGHKVAVEVLLESKVVGRLELARAAGGEASVVCGAGLFAPFSKSGEGSLVSARAAAVGEPQFVDLSPPLKGRILVTSDSIILLLRWEGSRR